MSSRLFLTAALCLTLFLAGCAQAETETPASGSAGTAGAAEEQQREEGEKKDADGTAADGGEDF